MTKIIEKKRIHFFSLSINPLIKVKMLYYLKLKKFVYRLTFQSFITFDKSLYCVLLYYYFSYFLNFFMIVLVFLII